MIRLSSEDATIRFGVALGECLLPGDVIALDGDLGTGKTTLARGILRGAGFAGEVASPTFPIVLHYDHEAQRLPVWHVDLYRIEDAAALEQLALDEARDEAALLIEWPGRMGAALWPDALRIALARTGESERALTALVPPAWEGRWPPP